MKKILILLNFIFVLNIFSVELKMDIKDIPQEIFINLDFKFISDQEIDYTIIPKLDMRLLEYSIKYILDKEND